MSQRRPGSTRYPIWRDPLVPAMASGTRLSAAKDRTFKTVRLNQGTLTDESKHLESHVWRLEQVIV